MNEYRKLFTSPTFKREDFATLLCRHGIEAAPVLDGVIIDYTAFSQMPLADMPVWIYLNRRDIHSKLRTRPASLRELRDAQGMVDGIKLIGVYSFSAWAAWEFGVDNESRLFSRYVYDWRVDRWEPIMEWEDAPGGGYNYKTADGMVILSTNIMRVGA